MTDTGGWRQVSGGCGAEPADDPRPVSLQWFFTRLFWLCLAPLVLLAAGLAWEQVHTVRARQTAQAEQLAAALVARVDAVLAARMAGLHLLAASPALDDPAQWQAARPLLLAARRATGDDVVLTDANLQPRIDTARPADAVLPPLHSAALRAAADRAIANGQPQVGDLAPATSTTAALVPTVVPVLRAGQAPRLLLVLTEASEVQRRLALHDLPPGWALSLDDATGARIAHHGWMAGPDDSAAAEGSLVHSQQLSVTGHRVTVSASPQVVRAPVLAAALALAGAVLSASLLGLVGAHLASRRMGRLLARLVEPDSAPSPAAGIAEIEAIRQALADAANRRAEAGATLLAGEARFRQLFHLAPLPQVLVDEAGRVVDLNQQFTSAFGYTLVDLATLEDWSRKAYPDPAYRATVVARRSQAQQQARGGDVVDAGQYRLRCKNGADRLVEVKLVMIGDQMLTSWLDVTAQRAAEDRSRQAQAEAAEDQRRARLASLNLIEDALAARQRLEAANAALQDLSQAIEQSAQAVVITDAGGRIEYVNEAFVRQTGHARADAVGQPVRMLKSGHTPAATDITLKAALARGETWRGEFINRRRDGRLAVDAAVITPLRGREGGAVTRYLALLEDVTEQRRQGEELARHRHRLEELVASRTAELESARAAAEAANLAKSAFLANMSHEIRTPLNAVIGLTHLQRLEPLSPSQRGRLDKIDAAAQHLLSIISDILDLSKIEAGQMQLELVDFELAPLLDGVRAMVASTAAAKGLALRVDIDAMPLWLRGDPTRLRQALLNFAGNAVKFTQQGQVTLRVRLLGSGPDGVQLRFEVQDSGIGIAESHLPLLFQPFAQADASTTRRFGGTGLGLAITRRLVDLMGGTVGASSQPGQGSTFWFTATLALAQGRHATVSRHSDDDAFALLQQRHAGALVLVVEDNPVNREVAEALLQAASLQVDSAENGREAVDRVHARRYDLVLMDMQLPEMDGLEATRAIRRDAALAGLPILAMTANAFAEDRQACLAAGMSDFVAKPVNPPDLYEALLRCLDIAPRNPAAAAPPAAATAPAPAASPMDLPHPAADPLAALSALLGPGVPATLARLRGDMPRYQRLLRQFIDQQRQDPERILALVRLGEPDEALRLAHDLKGASATLGAMQLSALAAAVLQGLRPQASPADTAAVPAQAQALVAEMQRLADGLEHLQAAASPLG
jgi:PAS domain S-box-containing protein